MNIPSNMKYTSSDEWVSVDGNTAKIGITDYAQEQLSDIVYVEYNVDVDDDLEKDSSIATIESVKAAADVKTPLNGKVLEVNDGLADTPESVNTEPYDSWMIKIELSDASELDALMDADAYKAYCEERES